MTFFIHALTFLLLFSWIMSDLKAAPNPSDEELYSQYVLEDPYLVPQRFGTGYLGTKMPSELNPVITRYDLYPVEWINTDTKGSKLHLINIWHDNKFWTATVDLNNIGEMAFQIVWMKRKILGENRTIPAAHAQIRININGGLKLHAQNFRFKGEKTKIKALVFSVEALAGNDFQFDFIKGMKDQYALSYRAVSIENVLMNDILKYQLKIQQILLDLNQKEKSTYIKEYLLKSNSQKLTRFYNTITDNCVSEQIELLKKVTNKKNSKKHGPINQTGDFFPIFTYSFLMDEKLTTKDLPDLNFDQTLKNPNPDFMISPYSDIHFEERQSGIINLLAFSNEYYGCDLRLVATGEDLWGQTQKINAIVSYNFSVGKKPLGQFRTSLTNLTIDRKNSRLLNCAQIQPRL